MNFAIWKEIDQKKLSLEERMFVLGSELQHLPEEPQEINRVFYNMGLDFYKIKDCCDGKSREYFNEDLKAFKKAIDDTMSGVIGDIEGDFPPHDEWVKQTYHSIVQEREHELDTKFKRLEKIRINIRKKCPNLVPTFDIQYQVLTAA